MSGTDLLLKGGVVVDPAQGINDLLDVAVKDGKVTTIAPEIAGENAKNAKRVIDVAGCVVAPGLIDLHTHVYWKGTSLGVDPNELCTATGVTTLVDAGSAGAGTFEGFRTFVIGASIPRIFAFLNISFAGILSNLNAIADNKYDYIWGECDPKLLDVGEAVRVSQLYPNLIRGIKVRLGFGVGDFDAFRLAKIAASEVGIPLMVHVSSPPPVIGDVLPLLNKGDILTHAFRGFPNSLVGPTGEVLDEAMEARDRGVIFDLGHGYGSFSFKTATTLLEQGFYPDVISSDIHSLSINGPVYDLPTTMSKMLNIGMPIDEVIKATTISPARAINLADTGLGSLKTGTEANISVLKIRVGKFEFKDAFGDTMVGDQRLTPVFTILKRKIYKKKGG